MPPEMISRMRRPCSTAALHRSSREYMPRRTEQRYLKQWRPSAERDHPAKGTILAGRLLTRGTVSNDARTDLRIWRVRGSCSRGRPGATEIAARAGDALPELCGANP